MTGCMKGVKGIFSSFTQVPGFSVAALKGRMEKDLDDVSKVAQTIKGKIEALDKGV